LPAANGVALLFNGARLLNYAAWVRWDRELVNHQRHWEDEQRQIRSANASLP